MVGAARFELATSCTPSKRASRATLRPDRFARSEASGRKLASQWNKTQQRRIVSFWALFQGGGIIIPPQIQLSRQSG